MMIECGTFTDLQNAFYTACHNILLKKLDHYGIRGISNDWLRSYLSDRIQFASMNSFNSDYKTMKFTVQQGSVLCPLFLLISSINSTRQ